MNELGETLRSARKERSLSVGEVAYGLDVPASHIAALETGDYGQFGSPAHARAYLRLYARYLTIDPEPLLLSEALTPELAMQVAPAGAAEPDPPGEPLWMDQGSRRRRWLPWALMPVALGAVVAAAVIVAGTPAPTGVTLTPAPEPAETVPTEEPDSTPETLPPLPTPEPTPDPPDEPEVDDDLRAPEDTRVQVLNGTADEELLAEVVDVLEALGYEVVMTGPARPYEETTVFATDGWEDEAAALLEADERFTTGGDNPGLSAEVDLHVVIGADWPDDE